MSSPAGNTRRRRAPALFGGPSHPPSGPGAINVIDFSGVTDASVEDVWIYDHVFGQSSVSLGPGSHLAHSRIGLARVDGPQGIWLGKGYYGRPNYERKEQLVDTSLWIRPGGSINAARIFGGDVAVRLGADSILSESRVQCGDQGMSTRSYCAEEEARPHIDRRPCKTDEDCPTNCLTEKPDCIGVLVDGAQTRVSDNQITATFIGIGSTARGFNSIISGNRIFSGEGPKISVQGAGWQITGNYLAWGSLPENGPVLQIGATPREGASGASAHVLISDNVIHGGSGEKYHGLWMIGLTGGKPRGLHGKTLVADNILVMSQGQNGIDLSGRTPGRVARGIIAGNSIQGGEIGIRFPPEEERARGLTVAANTFAGTARPLDGWTWSMGTALANGPLTSQDDSVSIVYLDPERPREIVPGMALSIVEDPEGNGVLAPAEAGATRIVGVALEKSGRDSAMKVATSGTTHCALATEGVAPVRAGNPLAVGEGGRFVSAASEAASVATALGPPQPDGRTRCLLP